MTMTQLNTKARFEILDGLRGVAAILVVLFHMSETYYLHVVGQPLAHGYLAVDFFFMLSGFVIGYAYDDRWGRGMTVRQFMHRRMVRLHPMLVIGMVFGLCVYGFTGATFDGVVEAAPWWMVLVVFLISITFIYTPRALDIHGWAEVAPLNAPAWSLFYEYLANIMYALVIRRFPRWLLALFVLLSAGLLADYALEFNLLGLVPDDHIPWGLNGGFSSLPGHFYMGFVRLCFAFFAGLLLYRVGFRLKGIPACYGVVSVIIAAAILPPLFGYGTSGAWTNAVYELAVLFLLFPLVVAMGAGGEVRGRHWQSLCRWMGEISYPLYITHYPWAYVHMAWVKQNPDATLTQNVMVCIGIFVLSIATAHATLHAFDMPIRRALVGRGGK